MNALDAEGLRAVLFDLDGVLIDSYEVWFAVMNDAARHFGTPEIDRPAFHAAWGQGVAADQAVFYPEQSIPEIEAFYHMGFPARLDALKILPGVETVFAALEARGLASAVITNTPMPLAGALVERAGGRPETIVGGTDVEAAKPAPDMVLEACARLGVAPGEAMVVGDTSLDRDAARAAGCRFVGIGIEGDWQFAGVAELAAP